MKRTPFIVVLFLIIETACGPGARENAAQPTFTPYRYPTTQSIEISTIQQLWFREDFENGIPANWIASPGWSAGASTVLSTLPEQTFRVPAEWTDLVIHARLRHGAQGWSSIGFRNNDDNYYQISFNQSSFILGRHSSGQLHGKLLATLEMTITTDWHDLIISAVGGYITISWDGQIVINYSDEDPLVSGDIFLQNWDNSLYELDFLEITPPEGVAIVPSGQPTNPTVSDGSTSPGDGQPVTVSTDTPQGGAPPMIVSTDTPPSGGGNRTPAPINLVVDLALSGGSFDGLENLWVTISNNGPNAYTGTIKISCTTWYTDARTSETFGLTAEKSKSLALEPGQNQDEQTACIKDEQLGPYIGSSINITSLPIDPNPVNNSLILYP
jgi:hypothetical protein